MKKKKKTCSIHSLWANNFCHQWFSEKQHLSLSFFFFPTTPAAAAPGSLLNQKFSSAEPSFQEWSIKEGYLFSKWVPFDFFIFFFYLSCKSRIRKYWPQAICTKTPQEMQLNFSEFGLNQGQTVWQTIIQHLVLWLLSSCATRTHWRPVMLNICRRLQIHDVRVLLNLSISL